MVKGCVESHQPVILEINQERQFIIKAVPGKKITINKFTFPSEQIIDHPFGAWFEVFDGIAKRIPSPDCESHDMKNTKYQVKEGEEPLTMEKLEELKASGVDGKEILRQIINSSVNYENKTSFSQCKWISRLEKKYLTRFQVKRITPRLLCNYMKYSARIKPALILEEDMLSWLIQMVGNSKKVLVHDETASLLSASLAWRVGEHGQIVSDTLGGGKQLREVLIDLDLIRKGSGEAQRNNCPACYTLALSSLLESTPASLSEDFKKRVESQNLDTVIEDEWLADCLVIATKYHPTPLLKLMMKFTRPGATIVIMTPSLRPLEDVCAEMTESGTFTFIRAGELLYKPWQVKPESSHPAMSFNASSGYALVGYSTCE